ncbi:hypothetical protein LO80_02775 [Candidatus Francisella endociliophora]|uniref:Lipoprotein n=1 Tax=Candidatus Francisella endociliophora TaxID=653937 RepID=A0A097EN67_9GAMM|nr:hypothetical protein [Francisella sp. FSC1006]AIT09005.1 hypothetical protein LO80_02775 [Francisella sp. FSC1006]
MKKGIITSLVALSLLSSCSLIGVGSVATQATYNNVFPEKWSEKATKEQQEEVKNQVMKLLEEEYKQPFKLESFEYKYEKHHETGGSINVREYGTYYFKIQAIDNPIIELDFVIKDKETLKDSIKSLIESFKKKDLKRLYCSSLGEYYSKNHANASFDKNAFDKNAKYCDERGDSEDYQFYIKYMSN